MPPKRRKTSEPASIPEPKRRVTRSSTKLNTTVAHDSPDDSPEAEQKASRIPRAPRPEQPFSNNANSRAEKPPAEDDSPAAQMITTLTITHDLVKRPMTCHQYTPLSPSPTLIFTHGAGGTLSADAVVNFCTSFSKYLPVLAFQGSMNLTARTKGFHARIDELGLEQKTGSMQKAREKRLLLGGRSMGARAAVIAASEWLAERKDGGKEEGELGVRLVLVSYPLRGPKDDLRDRILLDLPESVSVLFIVGDRDAMCPLDVLNKTRTRLTAKSQLVIVRGADHGMHVKPGSRTKEVGEETGRIAAKWVEEGLEGDVLHIGEEDEEE